MKTYIDNTLIRKLTSEFDEKKRNSLLNTCNEALKSPDTSSLQFVLPWPSLLEYLSFGSIFDQFPQLNDQNKIFSSVIKVLKMDSEKDVIIYLYDQIFVECLTQVKGLQFIHPQFLRNQIQHKYKNPLFPTLTDPFLACLISFEKKLLESPQEVIHDLTLYLAWDRVCVYLAAIFDHTTLKIHHGLEVLKECLIESFHHITNQGTTFPSFFRLIEALYAYEMKEENLQNHTDSEWQILCQSATALRSREYLADISYLDACIKNEKDYEHSLLTFLTLDSSERVKAGLSLAKQMIKKLKLKTLDWQYDFIPCEIMCLKEIEHDIIVEKKINP